jgi:hypothetical protein
MKTLRPSITVTSVFIALTIVMPYASAQNNTSYLPLNDLEDGNVFLMAVKGPFLSGGFVGIYGNLVTVNPIRIVLYDPHGETVTSKTTFSDRNGYFASELRLPTGAVEGMWRIVGTSGTYHKELNFTTFGSSDTVTCYGGSLCSPMGITSTHSVMHGVNPIALQSPLKQLKSGTKPDDIKCGTNFQLVLKGSNNSTACIKKNDVSNFMQRTWAIKTIRAENTDLLLDYAMTNGHLENVTADLQSKSIIFSVKTIGNGTLITDIPRLLFDPKMTGQDMQFFVLKDGQEIDFTETKTSADRILTIPFTNSTLKIEIIVSTPQNGCC